MFKNHNPDKQYSAFLYKQEKGQTVSQIFHGEEACQEAIDDGWVMTPAKFVKEKAEKLVEEGALPEEQKEAFVQQTEYSADEFANDANILANCDAVENIEKLKLSYEKMAGKPMHHKVNTLEGARKACKKLLGELDGNG